MQAEVVLVVKEEEEEEEVRRSLLFRPRIESVRPRRNQSLKR